MHINPARKKSSLQQGVTLIELIVFLVVIGITSGAIFLSFNYSMLRIADPLIEVRALELAQSKLDEILALKYDANTPTGGIPACGSTGAVACNNTPDGNMNDVDDFNGFTDVPYSVVVNGITYAYSRSVTVTTATNQKLISVSVAGPKNYSVRLAAYKANF